MDEMNGYNGAYTGAQIDAAIGAVRNKETTWDGKQDKLTGVQGQVVGFDDDGDAVAMPAPDTGVTTFNGRTGAVTPQSGDYTADMVGARAANWTPTAADVGAVPTDRTVNGQALSQNITLNAENVGARPATWLPAPQEINAVPTSRTVNGHELSANITLSADDVGARADSWMPSATDVGAIPASQKGANNGVAELDDAGRVPSTQLPSYVDDVIETYIVGSTAFASDWLSTTNGGAALTPEGGKIYIVLSGGSYQNREFRWSGTQYAEISPSIALGETSSTAYRGDRGATAYSHSQITSGNPHGTTATDVGAVPVSTTVNGKALNGNITLDADDIGARANTWMPTAGDVGAVPTSRTVNSKALSADITLTASDVGAASAADVEAVKPFKVAITIPTSGWSNNQQTFTVNGIPSDPQNHEVRLATVGATNTQALEDAGLRIADEAANSLTLKVSTVPTASFQVYAVITPLK